MERTPGRGVIYSIFHSTKRFLSFFGNNEQHTVWNLKRSLQEPWKELLSANQHCKVIPNGTGNYLRVQSQIQGSNHKQLKLSLKMPWNSSSNIILYGLSLTLVFPAIWAKLLTPQINIKGFHLHFMGHAVKPNAQALRRNAISLQSGGSYLPSHVHCRTMLILFQLLLLLLFLFF